MAPTTKPSFKDTIVAILTAKKAKTSVSALIKETLAKRGGDPAREKAERTQVKLALKKLVDGGLVKKIKGIGATGSVKMTPLGLKPKKPVAKKVVKKVAKKTIKKVAKKAAAPKPSAKAASTKTKKPTAKKAAVKKAPAKKAPVKKAPAKKVPKASAKKAKK